MTSGTSGGKGDWLRGPMGARSTKDRGNHPDCPASFAALAQLLSSFSMKVRKSPLENSNSSLLKSRLAISNTPAKTKDVGRFGFFLSVETCVFEGFFCELGERIDMSPSPADREETSIESDLSPTFDSAPSTLISGTDCDDSESDDFFLSFFVAPDASADADNFFFKVEEDEEEEDEDEEEEDEEESFLLFLDFLRERSGLEEERFDSSRTPESPLDLLFFEEEAALAEEEEEREDMLVGFLFCCKKQR